MYYNCRRNILADKNRVVCFHHIPSHTDRYTEYYRNPEHHLGNTIIWGELHGN